MAFWNQDDDGDDEVLNEINVVPLIDIMLVLLVLFIVTASAITTEIQVNLPQADAEAQPTDNKPLIISVDADGLYHLGGEEVNLDQLQERLTNLHDNHPKQTVQLQADRSVPFETVSKVMAAIQVAGIQKIAVLTEP